MSKLKLDKINFNDSDFVVEVIDAEKKAEKEIPQIREASTSKKQEVLIQADIILNSAKSQAQELVDEASRKANELVQNAQIEATKRKEEIIEEAKKRADEIVELANLTSQKDVEELIEKTKEEIEQKRIEATRQGYEEGHKDGLEKVREELEEKLDDFSKFCLCQYEVRQKILKSANKDILDLVVNITKKILHKELDFNSIDKIIKSTIALLEKKENVTIILSEKYAKLLYEHQKNALDDEIELNFEDFKQYQGYDIIYNPDFDDDTIIVENLKERFDASINSQLDVIIRNIYDNTQNGKLDLEQYLEDEAE